RRRRRRRRGRPSRGDRGRARRARRHRGAARPAHRPHARGPARRVRKPRTLCAQTMTTEHVSPDFYEAPEAPPGVEVQRPPRWPPWTAVVALVAGLAAALFGALVIGVVAVAFGANFNDEPPAVTITATVVQDLCLIGSAVLFARMYGRFSPADFGLRPTRLWPAIGWDVLGWLAFLVFTAAFVAIVGGSPNDDKLPQELGVDDS